MKFIAIIFSIVLLLGPGEIFAQEGAQTKEFKITTYYPAPHGEYRQLKATGSDTSNNAIALEAKGSFGTGLVVTNANRVGIGTAAPGGALDVRGQIRTASAAGTVPTAQNTIDWNNGNVMIANPTQASLTFQNMQDGGSYTLIITSTTSRTYTFNQAGLTFKFQPANAATTANTHTVYTFIRAGTTVYVSWIKGY